ncbi:MAG TPA: SpoIIE family protein phosphatase [Conexibacter sp.]|nr:SpoIIE family protein phosphatase [Conexibacter sp.]
MRRRRLPRDPSAVALARRAVEADAATLSDEQLDVARLLVSELVTNAVRHGAGDEVVLVLRVDDACARFEVHDAGGQRPARREPRGAKGGYGLNLVASLASRWGANDAAGVWFELDRPRSEGARPKRARPEIDDMIARQLGTVLDGLAEAVTVSDARGHTVYANDAAVRLLRLTAVDRAEGAAGHELMSRFDVYDEHGAPVSLEQLPGSRVRAGEHEPAPMLVRNVVKATGEERWLLNKTTTIEDEAGRVVRVVNVIEDVTEAKRAELAQRLLAEASDVLASSLDYEATLQRVADVAVPGFADWCGVDLPTPGGVLQSVAVAHVDPAKVALARHLRARYPVRLDASEGMPTVVRGESSTIVVHDVPDADLVAYARDEEHLALLREIGFSSLIVVPLAAGGETLGALTLVRSTPGRVFDDADIQLAEELGRRAGTAVLNARTYTERATIAATLQRGLRPPELLAPPGFAIATHYEAVGEFNEVGGDFYDAFTTADGWMLVVGDVAGHGAEAAALTALARWTLRSTGQLTRDPGRAVRQLNATLRDLPQLSLCTNVCAHVRADAAATQARVTLANAGHPRPLLVRGGQLEELGRVGPMAGAFDDSAWDCTEVALQAGDTLVLYTDGVLDTVGTDDRFGEGRLRAALEAAGTAEPRALVAAVASALDAFREGPQRDDTAIVAMCFVGVPASAYEVARAGS